MPNELSPDALTLLESINTHLSTLAEHNVVTLWESPHVWLTSEEMAGLISSQNESIGPKALQEKARNGQIPGHKFPGSNQWRFNPREVSEHIHGEHQKRLVNMTWAEKKLAEHRKRNQA